MAGRRSAEIMSASGMTLFPCGHGNLSSYLFIRSYKEWQAGQKTMAAEPS